MAKLTPGLRIETPGEGNPLRRKTNHVGQRVGLALYICRNPTPWFVSNPARPAATAEALVRAHFGLTQPELARYLGVSAAVLAHYETGRRLAPAAALVRLTRLARLLPPPEGTGPAEALAPEATPANPAALPAGTPLAPAPLHNRWRDCRLQALLLTQQLQRLQRRAAVLDRRRRGLAQLQAALTADPDPAEAARLAGWLAEVAEDLAAADCNPAAAASDQVLLAVRIAALTTEADALGRLLAGASPPGGI